MTLGDYFDVGDNLTDEITMGGIAAIIRMGQILLLRF